MLVDFMSLLIFHFTVLRSLRTVNMKRKHIFTDGKGAGSGTCVDNIHLRGSASSDEGACDFSSASQLRRSTGRVLMRPSVSPCPWSPGPAHLVQSKLRSVGVAVLQVSWDRRCWVVDFLVLSTSPSAHCVAA